MAKHLMCDLETLATTPNAAILSLGAVTFDPNSEEIYESFYKKICLDSLINFDHFIDDETIKWWGNQSKAAQDEAFSQDGRTDIELVLNEFYKFCQGCTAFWSHGSSFDLVILEHYFRQIKKPAPWNFWQLRDTRTLFDLGFDPEMPKDNLHHALEDARRQAIGVQNIFNKLNRKFR